VVPAYEPAISPDGESRYFSPAPEPESRGTERLVLLWRERRFLFGVASKAFVSALVMALMLPVHYEAVTRIVPGENQVGASGLLGKFAAGSSPAGGGFGLGLDSTSLLGLKTQGALYVEIMKSRTVEDRLIDRFDLRRHYWMLGRFHPATYYDTRKKLRSFTDFVEDKKSGVITLTCTDYDKRTAAAIANAYVEELNRLAADLNTSDAHRERVFLEARLKSAKQDLDQASLVLSQFSSKNTVMDPQDQGRSMMDATARIQGEIIAGEAELKGLREIYSEDNVKVRALRARIAELQGQWRKILGGATGGDASGAGSSGYPSMRSLPILGYQYTDLYRQAKIQETVYEFLTQQYELAKIQEAKELPTVRVMDPAVPAERKSGPVRTLVVGFSVLIGLGLACFWVLSRTWWERLPREDPRRLLAAEVSADVRASVRRLTRSVP
jgi:uncharacterized protein involved in exopolysaccharide biosynthesis